MPTTTSRLALPYPVITDPADVPGDMGNLAQALDAGSNPNFSGVAVFVATPGVVGSLPAAPVKGCLYPVNSSPPYLLYYTGEATSGTAQVPTGWRNVGGVGTNTANIQSAAPGNSVTAGSQPVWAALDHAHATPPWGVTGQVEPSNPGDAVSGGVLAAYARVDHVHARESLQTPIGGTILWPWGVSTIPANFLVLNGTTYNTTTYAPLYALIGTNVLPNWNDRIPLGAGGSISPLAGDTGGSTTITTSNLPSHTHTYSEPNGGAGHAHATYIDEQSPSYQAIFTVPAAEANQISSPGGINVSYSPSGGGQLHWAKNVTGITINSTGGGTPYLQPYVGAFFIVRAA
jgi:hypothetical protein